MKMNKAQREEQAQKEKLLAEAKHAVFKADLDKTLFALMVEAATMRDVKGMPIDFKVEMLDNVLKVTFESSGTGRHYYDEYDKEYQEIIYNEAEEWQIQEVKYQFEMLNKRVEEIKQQEEEARVREIKRQELIARLSKEDLELLGVVK